MKKLVLGLAASVVMLSACGSTQALPPAPEPSTTQPTILAPTTSARPTATPSARDTNISITPTPTEIGIEVPENTLTASPSPTATPSGSATASTGTAIPEPPITSAPPAKTIALTFDDGPTDYTPQIMKILLEKNVMATFFQLGVQVEQYPKYSKELALAGNSVQSHTYSHATLTSYTNDGLANELNRSKQVIKDATGVMPTCIRPPYGTRDARTDQISKSVGLDTIIWDIDTKDWTTPGKNSIIKEAVNSAHPGGVILMHDGGGDRSQTVAALPKIIDELKTQGYTFVTLCQ